MLIVIILAIHYIWLTGEVIKVVFLSIEDSIVEVVAVELVVPWVGRIQVGGSD